MNPYSPAIHTLASIGLVVCLAGLLGCVPWMVRRR